MTIQNMVSAKLGQWEKENGMHFCAIMQKGGTWSRVQYPTGLILLRAEVNGKYGYEKAEIHLDTAKKIRKSDWKICLD